MNTRAELEYFALVERILYIERRPDAHNNVEYSTLLDSIDEYEEITPYKGSYRESRNNEEQMLYDNAMAQYELEMSIQEPFDTITFQKQQDEEDKRQEADEEWQLAYEKASAKSYRREGCNYQEYMENGWNKFVEDALDGERGAGWNLD
ncbi:hypothetical protein [uncultured Hymenobacter sp.]|uniref:hypothetical protein n=1 Tax=uncultured Hymenobacter sp. TaxID=170016 RepID=UPI0035CA4306